MSKYSAGLHKDVSAIFDGVAIPKTGAVEIGIPQSSNSTITETPAPTPEHQHPLYSKVEKNNSEKIAKQQQTPQIILKIKEKFSSVFQSAASPKQKMMTLLIPILLIVFIWVLFRAFGTTPTRTTKAGQFNPTPTPAISAKETWKAPEPYPADIRDPMEFTASAPTATTTTNSRSRYEKLVVKGIVYSANNPTAIVGNEIVAVGDIISGITVVKINVDSVEFELDGQRWTQKVQD